MVTNNKTFYLVITLLIAAIFFTWQPIIFPKNSGNLELNFLDVGQGDSELINFPDDVQILIDGGRGPKVLAELEKSLEPQDRYLDIVIATHPDFDHYGGLIDVLKNYKVGAIITNGREGTVAAYQDFKKAIAEAGLEEINLFAGDKIKYKDTILDVLWPFQGITSKAVNESGIVIMLEKGGLRALYTADIGTETERELTRRYNLSAQILKVAHHGSKYSSDSAFLKEVQPEISIIEVGKNTYGHPTSVALDRLADIGSKIFRTDLGGTIKAIFDGVKLKIYN